MEPGKIRGMIVQDDDPTQSPNYEKIPRRGKIILEVVGHNIDQVKGWAFDMGYGRDLALAENSIAPGFFFQIYGDSKVPLYDIRVKKAT